MCVLVSRFGLFAPLKLTNQRITFHCPLNVFFFHLTCFFKLFLVVILFFICFLFIYFFSSFSFPFMFPFSHFNPYFPTFIRFILILCINAFASKGTSITFAGFIIFSYYLYYGLVILGQSRFILDFDWLRKSLIVLWFILAREVWVVWN
jgi:hypothetical protein